MRDDRLRAFLPRRTDRRTILKGAGATLTLAAATPFFRTGAGAATLRQTPTTADISGTSLSILLWSHFVPLHDVWFDQFVKEWGEANGVTTQVDHINTADVPAAIAAEITAGQGHDIVEHIASLAQYEKSVLDMTDVVQELNNRHGEQLPMAMRNSTTRQPISTSGSAMATRPTPATTAARSGERSRCRTVLRRWDDLLAGGTQIKQEQGVQMGIGMSNESDSRMAAQTLIWAYGAAIQDENENVTINSPETVAAVKYMSQLFKTAMTPEVFGWNAASNNQLLVAGRRPRTSSTRSLPTARRRKSNPRSAADIFFRTPLVGPAGEDVALAHGHAVFISMIPNLRPIPTPPKSSSCIWSITTPTACKQSELYNFPAWPSTVPDLEKLAR